MRWAPDWIVVVGLGMLVLVASCASAPAVHQQCLPMKGYTAAEEHALGAAVLSLPTDSLLIGAMADYGALRAANRACAGTLDTMPPIALPRGAPLVP